MDDNFDHYIADIHSEDDDVEIEEYYEEFSYSEVEDVHDPDDQPVRIACAEYHNALPVPVSHVFTAVFYFAKEVMLMIVSANFASHLFLCGCTCV